MSVGIIGQVLIEKLVMIICLPVCRVDIDRESSFLDLYEPLDIIGNGSFGSMSERDRKQIVMEV